MLKKLPFLGLLVALFGMSSCETEFSLNGEYELTPVVFGLLDQTDTIHMIKITKAYLGDGNNLEYAKIADSNYFRTVEAKIIELLPNGDPTDRSWELQDSIVTGKSTDGVFYAPDQKIYFFKEPNLVAENTYRLEASFNEGQMSISSETSLIYNFKVPNSINYLSAKIALAPFKVEEDDDYTNMNFTILDVINAGNSEFGYTVNWTEHYLDGSTSSFSVRKFESRSDDPESLITINSLGFYKWIQETIPDDENVDYRTLDGIDLHFSYGHVTLKQYMEVSSPVTGIAQVQPTFTNINGGYGLFSSRFQYTKYNLPLNATSLEELKTGKYTYTKKFQ